MFPKIDGITTAQQNEICDVIFNIIIDPKVQGAISSLRRVPAQKLIHDPRTKVLIRDQLLNFIGDLSTTNQFAKEVTKPEFPFYFSGYNKPKYIGSQCELLQRFFPGLGDPNRDLVNMIDCREIELPVYSEGWFAVANWMKHPEIFGADYLSALKVIFNKIKGNRGGFYNYFDGPHEGLEHLRQSDLSVKFWKELSEAQGNPGILIIPGQFGLRHFGRSPRRAWEVFSGNEVSLGAFAVGNMLLIHPKRLMHPSDSWIDCSGDEYIGDSGVVRVPVYAFEDEISLQMCRIDMCRSHSGSPSAFIPQVEFAY